ncbi:hypothetical protein [Leptospira kmetyi]|uniref:hypothetical protein n=1 Tax=Leptospira kmetyi TaxID=408139 RepID=UPI000289FC14|nr:hypothetical protein [Leptospira kmetyi]EQA52884.1 hypothetical protein LEP1GSC052_3117 [Leptospira kmetyi serovar Malaysia str. Bejo-Iso9]TGK16610.1 hypothetical protein EHO62_12855 [Leptospira kmetyi]TGK33987.1 hypothetical protein EHO66_01080 [Leptospira kmetyi]TGL66761.1 hypothetical protein EHQ67_15580 [Leptospira kmetyi]
MEFKSGIVCVIFCLLMMDCENIPLQNPYSQPPKPDLDLKDSLIFLVLGSASNSRTTTPFRCTGNGELQSSFATCYVPGTGNQIFDVNANALINTTTVSVGTDLRCKCSDREIVDGFSWYVYSDTTAASGRMLGAVASSYLTKTYPETLTGYPAGIKFVCMPSFCRSANATYQIIESVP